MTRKWAMIGVLSLAVGTAAQLGAREVEVPAGTRFLVELRDKLDANKVKPGKKFEARTLEPLRAMDGTNVPAGAKLKGRVSSVDHNRMMLRFEEIDTGRGKRPIVATVVGLAGERDANVKGREGEIRADGHRGRDAAIGAAVVGGLGAAIGATQAGGKGAAIGAGSGAAAGGLIGASAGGGRDLVLQQGARIELQLDRPLSVPAR